MVVANCRVVRRNRVGGRAAPRVAPPPLTPPHMGVRVRRFLAVLTDRPHSFSATLIAAG
jgi:hypothetical protein